MYTEVYIALLTEKESARNVFAYTHNFWAFVLEKTVNHSSVQADKLFPLIFLKVVLGLSFCSAKFLLQVDHTGKKKGNCDDCK